MEECLKKKRDVRGEYHTSAPLHHPPALRICHVAALRRSIDKIAAAAEERNGGRRRNVGGEEKMAKSIIISVSREIDEGESEKKG